MARGIFTKINENWTPITKVFTKIDSTWTPVQKVFTKIDSTWNQVFPAQAPVSCPVSDTYTLQPTSLFLDTAGTATAEFNTAQFQFANCIKEIRIVLTWTNTSLVNTTLSIRGRPSNTFYRDIDNINHEWDGRVIDHRIDTFNAASLTEFNNGSSIGFNIQLTSDPNFVSTVISNVQLKLTT